MMRGRTWRGGVKIKGTGKETTDSSIADSFKKHLAANHKETFLTLSEGTFSS